MKKNTLIIMMMISLGIFFLYQSDMRAMYKGKETSSPVLFRQVGNEYQMYDPLSNRQIGLPFPKRIVQTKLLARIAALMVYFEDGSAQMVDLKDGRRTPYLWGITQIRGGRVRNIYVMEFTQQDGTKKKFILPGR